MSVTARNSTTTATARTAGRSRAKKPVGKVAFVAAGPGDPELLTVRAVRLLADAEVVVADAGAGELVRDLLREDAEVVLAVDDEGHPVAPSARAKLVADAARAGRQVVRLLAGDPIMDGSLALEAAALSKSRLGFEVAPGVSLLSGVTAYAGAGLVGGKAREVRVVDFDDPGVDWAAHSTSRVSLVVLGAADRVAELARVLLDAGRAASTPVAVTRGVTTLEQCTVSASLEEIAAAAKAARHSGPGVVVVGEAVAQRRHLSWFETKPLFGWRVLVPRTREQPQALTEQLVRYGARTEEVPTISVEPPRTPQQMERAITGMVSGRYQWVAFTSVNAVRAVRERFEQYGLDARAFAGLKVAAVGEQTASALVAFGVRPDLMPTGDQTTAELLADWPEYDPVLDPINRVFLPRADIATDTLAGGLVELGWEVEDVTAYRTVRAAPPPAPIRDAIKTGAFDAVLFTSSSTVRNLVGIAGKPHASTVVACIGPATAKAAEEHGLKVDVLSPEPTVSALAEALAAHGDALRLAALETGEHGWRPSRRRSGARRKAT